MRDLGTDRTSVRYRHRGGDDAPLRARLRALAGERRRFGYRRLGLLLKRDGLAPNHKKLRRLCAEEWLQVHRRFRVLCVVDGFTRERPALVADTSLSGQRVVRELYAIAARRGYPATVVSGNGTELTSSAVLAWSQDRGVGWHYTAPGRPQQRLHRKLQRQAAQ